MAIKIGINGMGRIGEWCLGQLLRAKIKNYNQAYK